MSSAARALIVIVRARLRAVVLFWGAARPGGRDLSEEDFGPWRPDCGVFWKMSVSPPKLAEPTCKFPAYIVLLSAG